MAQPWERDWTSQAADSSARPWDRKWSSDATAAPAGREAVPDMTVGSVAQDALSGALQIGPTAVKGVADIARMLSGDWIGKDTSEAMERGMESIRDTVGSERAAAQRRNFNADMGDDSVGIAETIARNKGALADQLLPTIGSMFLPVGAAAGAGRLAQAGRAAQSMDKAALAARVASAQTAAGVGTTAAQNAADTFAELVDRGVPMEDAYVAAGITVPFTVIAGKLTGGGAEVAAARALTGTSAARAGAGQALKAAGREGAQEMGEELGQIVGEGVGTGVAPSLMGAGKQLAVAGTLGAVMGGGVDVATMARNRGAPTAPGAPTEEPGAPGATPPAAGAVDAAELLGEVPQAPETSRATVAPLSEPGATGAESGIPGNQPFAGIPGNQPSPESVALTAEPTPPTALPPVRAVPGLATSFSTETGARLDAAYSLVEADDLQTSHDTNLRVNPAYPAELQPRQRERAASAQQISSIQARLDPARLGLSADAATGAPIIGEDGLVESGNARTIALKRVYDANGQKAEDYKAFLRQNAAQFGLTPEQIDGMQRPVLVRMRTTPVNRAEFARQANASTVAQMAPSEMAKSDANRIDSLEDLRPDDQGDFATSRDFIRRFMAKLPGTEQAGMIDATGRLSSAGYARVRNAVLAKAYGDSPVLTRMVESMDDNQRNITKALMIAAPRVAQARGAIAEGRRFDADITPHLVGAAESLSALKEAGTSVDDALAQAGLLGEEFTPETRELLQFLAENTRRPRKIADFITAYFDALDAAGDPAQGSLLGDTQAPTTTDLMGAARRSTGAPDEAGNAQDPKRRNDREAAPAGGRAAGQPADAQGGRGGAEGDGAAGAGAANEAQGPEWERFGPDTGTLGIPRANMPQVKVKLRPQLYAFLASKGITAVDEEVAAADLKPTQAEYSPKKAQNARTLEGDAAGVLVSSDGYVLDGHHRWLSRAMNREPVQIKRFSVPIDQLLDAVREFSGTTTSNESATLAQIRTEAVEEFYDAAGDLAQILTKYTRAAMVPESTPNLMPTLVKLAGAAIKVVGTDLKRVTAWVKERLKADPETKPYWNKVSAEAYRKAAEQALAQMDEGGGLFAAAEPEANADARAYDMKRDNFKPPRTEEFLQAELLDLARGYVAKFAKEAPPLVIDPQERAAAEAVIQPMLDAAASVKEAYDQKILDIAQRTGSLGQMLAPIKGMKRAAEKLVLEPRAADGSMDPTALKDLLRSTIVVSTYADAQKVVDEIYREFTVMKGRVKDRTDANIQAPDVTGRRGFLPSGYGDVLINVVMPNGTTAEIQINVPEMLAAKENEGHKLYEVERNQPMGSEVQKAVEAAQTDFYRAAAAAAAARNAASLEPAADRGSARASRSSPVASSSLNTLPSGNATQSSPEKSETKRQPAGNESGTRTGDILQAQTPEELKAKAAREKAAADADAAEQRRLENKAKADAEVDRFQLTGSDRPADAAGQDSLFERKRAKYNPAQGDLFAQQLDLFLDSQPDPSQAGPGVEEARRVAAEALRLLRRSGTVLGRALSGGLAERQRVDLVGQVAKTPADLALLAQVYRDPRFETFRVFFTNSKGAVVAHAGLTSRLPGSTAAIVGRDAREYLRKMLPKAKAAGATGFFMLHNHPSGRSEPSTADEFVTRLFALNAAELEPSVKFKGHVVIDTNEYATIDSRGEWMVKKTDFGAPQPHDNGEAWAGTQISSPQDVMELTKRLEVTGDAVTLMVLNFQNRVMQIATVPGAALSGTRAAATTAVRRAILAGTGAKVVAVSRNQAAIDNVVRHRLALDAILVTEDGKAVSAAALAGVAGSARALPDDRGVRVTADTSPAFDYLRQEALEERVNRALIRSVVGGRRAAEPAPKMAKTDTPEFKRWFGDSKVVDADGKPLVVYHGTGASFDRFDPAVYGTNFTGDYGVGFYFSQNPKDASRYAASSQGDGANVMPVYLSLKNPKIVKAAYADGDLWASVPGAKTREELTDGLKAQGYDGVIVDGGRAGVLYVKEAVAFRPEQIKSAISNTTFDPNNPSILAEPQAAGYGANAAPTAADRAESLIQKKAATPAPVDAAFKAAARVTGIQRATTMLYGLGARLIDRITPERVKAGVISDYGVPEAVIDQRAQMQGSQRAQLKQAGALLEKLATMTRAESRVAYEWMSGDDTRTADELMKELPEASVKVLEEVRQMVDQLSQEAMRLGQLDPEAFKRHRFAYLRRSYFKHATDLTPQEKTARQRAISILGDQYKGRGMTAKAPMRQVQNIAPEWWKRKLQEGKADTSLKGEKFERLERRAPRGDGTVGLEGMGENTRPGKLLEVHFWPAGEPKPAKYADWESAGTWEVRDTKGGDLVMWRDFTKAERVKMGEIDEARYAIAKTLHRMVHDVEVGRYLEWLSQRYAKKPGEEFTGQIVEASERFKDAFKPGEWVQVPDTKIPGTSVLKYGALAGRYLPGPIWNDLRQVVNGRFQPLGETYQQILSMWKTAKTALSPGVHTNNIMSNFVMADWHDVSAGHVQKALRILLAAHQRDGKGAIGRAGNAAARLGFADREAAIEIMNRYQVSGGNIGGWITQEIANDQLEPIIEALQAEVAATASKAAPQEIGVYAALQHLMHARFGMAWESFKGSRPASAVAAEGKSLIDLYQAEDDVFRLAAWLKAKEGGASDGEAGKVARKSFLDYSINAPWVAAMRSTAFPFIAYTYRAVPMLLETFAKKPHKVMKLMALAGGLNWLGVMLGGDGEDKERKLLPEEKAGRIWGLVPKLIRMPWNDAQGSPVYLDVRRWIPVGDVADLGAGQAALPLPPAAYPGGPLVILGEIFMNKSAFTGKPITLETDTATEKAGKIIDHLWKAAMPNIIGLPGTYATEGVVGAVKGRTDAFGREMSVPMAVSSAMGVKLGAYPDDVLRRNLVAKKNAQEAEIDKEISGLKRQRMTNRIDDEEFAEKLQAQQAKKVDLARKLAEQLN